MLMAYPTLLHAYWERAVTYRVVFVVALLNAAFPLVMMAIWIGMAQAGPVAGYTATDFASYYIICCARAAHYKRGHRVGHRAAGAHG
jgi:ABC-2 type transport system permease protein